MYEETEEPEMLRELLDALSMSRGHFLYESGHHGDLWLDLNAAFVEPCRVRKWASELARLANDRRPRVICGPLVGGALLAQFVAGELGARFVMAEQLASADGEMLYRIPQSLRPRVAGQRVLLVDDAVNAGFAWTATLAELKQARAEIVGFATLVTLGGAAQRIADEHRAPLFALARLERGMWAPEQCPLCRAGAPLTYDLIRR